MKDLILWMISKLSRGSQKSIVLKLLNVILLSKDSSIDNKTAEKIVTMAIKSQGNTITSFIIKD